MTGFKVIIKATAHSMSNAKLEQYIKTTLEESSAGIIVNNIKAKGTKVLHIIDPLSVLERTINSRNSEIHKLTMQADKDGRDITRLEAHVQELERIIHDKEEQLLGTSAVQDGDFCTCHDWRSIGSDPETGDKLKRCNICDRIGVR